MLGASCKFTKSAVASAQELVLSDPNYVLFFVGVYPGSGKLTGLRFTTALLTTDRIFQISNVTIDACASACDIDQTCLGFYFRVNSDGITTTCTALNNIGSASGSITTSNAYSYAKQVRQFHQKPTISFSAVVHAHCPRCLFRGCCQRQHVHCGRAADAVLRHLQRHSVSSVAVLRVCQHRVPPADSLPSE